MGTETVISRCAKLPASLVAERKKRIAASQVILLIVTYGIYFGVLKPTPCELFRMGGLFKIFKRLYVK